MRVLLAVLLLLNVAIPIAAADQILRRPSDAEPETLDPQKSNSFGPLAIDRDLFEGLVGLSPTLAPIPGVAERWDVSADGLQWIFHLRPDAKWSNGDPVTAEDFVYSFRRLVDPKTAASDPGKLAQIVNAKEIVSGKQPDLTKLGVTATDPHTLRITLIEPRASFVLVMSDPRLYPLHRATIENWGNEWTRPGHIVSNGPFVLSSWTPQGEIVLTKNPAYYDGDKIKLDAVHWVVSGDMQAALRSYRNGELNLVRLSRDTIGWARDNDPTELVVTPVNGSVILVFNMTKGPLKQDIRLREAINLAIDRSVIVSKIDNRGETASYGVVSPTTTNYSPQPMPFKDQPMALRLARARTLVNDAGYSPTQPLKLTIGYPTSDAAKQILTVIRQMVLPIGVELSLENMEWQVFASRVNQRDLDIAFIGIESAYDDPEEALESYFGAAGNANLSGYQNPGFDALYHAGLVDMDRARRRSEFERAERMIVDDYAFAPIENDSESFLVSSKVKGFVGVQRFPQSRYLSLEN